MQHPWHFQRIEPIASSLVDAKTVEFSALVEETKTIAIGKRHVAIHHKTVRIDFLHTSHGFAQCLRSVEREYIGIPSVQEIVCEPTVERLAHIGLKFQFHRSFRCTSVFLRVLGNECIECQRIGCRHILHVSSVFQSSLNLERRSTRLSQILQGIDLAQVLQRKQMLLLDKDIPLVIFQVEFHSAHLRTFASVGTASEDGFRRVTLPTQAHTQRTMHEHLQLRLWVLLMNLPDFLQTQFASQHHLLKALFTQKANLL